MGEWKYISTIIDLSTRLRWIVSFTSRSLYPLRRNPRYPFHRRLCGLHNRSGRCGVEKNLLALPGIEPLASSPSRVAIPTELSRNVIFWEASVFMSCLHSVYHQIFSLLWLTALQTGRCTSWCSRPCRWSLCSRHLAAAPNVQLAIH
jgi:hypothetical protein